MRLGKPSIARNRLVTIAKIVTSIGLFAFCLRGIEFKELARLLVGANVPYLIAGAALVLFETVLGAYRFKLLFDPFARLKLTSHVYQYFAAGYFNLFLPSSIGGDALRVIWLAKAAVSPSTAFSLVVIERVMGVCSLVLLSVLAQCWFELPRTIELFVTLAVVLTVLSLLAVALAYRYWRPRPINIRWVNDAVATLGLVLRDPKRILVVFVASVLYQIITVGITYVVVLAFSLPVHWLAVFALVPLVWFATFLPISVGGLGVREASFIFLFATIGISQEAAMIMSIGTYAIFVWAGIVGGVWFTATQARPGKAP